MDKKALEMFWYWVNERERIRINREEKKLPYPWSDDYILSHFRFCNVRREDDRVTRWVKENIRDPYKYDPNLWFMLTLARNFNLPSTLQEIMDHNLWPTEETGYKPKRIASLLNKRMQNHAVFNSAYIINAANAQPGYTKVDHICRTVLQNMWKDRKVVAPAMQQSFVQTATHVLMGYPGMGSFMAYQVVVDLTWCPGWLDEAIDLNDWAAVGPGSKRGINRITGNCVHASMSLNAGIEQMYKLYCDQIYRLDENVFTETIRLSDIQNCLCEYDKYARAKLGTGKPKRKVHYGN